MRSSSWRSGKELEVRPGARGPGDGGQEAEGSEAGGPGAGTSGLVAGEGFRRSLVALGGWRNRLSKSKLFCAPKFLGWEILRN